ncbi:MAG: DUF4097 family beta strand repeat-containing protein [Pseudomonadota bacterium]
MRPLLVLLLLPIASPAAAWGDCEHRAERRATLEAGGLRSLVLRAGAGGLEVIGEKGRTTIEAVGSACADSAERLDQIRLDSGRDGDRARLVAVLPDSGGGWMGGDYASLSLVVRVPESLAVDAEDSSGDARFTGFASLAVADSSGDLRIEGIAGALSVADSRGDIDVRETAGPVTVRRDSSGDIEISGVASDVQVEKDTSGDIQLRNIGGTARVGSDSSGEIVFDEIAGDVEVGRDGSGGIRANRVGASFTVRADGSGGISHAEVNGRVSIPAD